MPHCFIRLNSVFPILGTIQRDLGSTVSHQGAAAHRLALTNVTSPTTQI